MLTLAPHALVLFAVGGRAAAHPAADTTSQLTRDGLWLIALGGVLVAAGLVAGGHLGGLSTRLVGAQGQAGDRLAFSLGLVGAMLVAGGGIIAAAEEAPETWIVVMSVVGSGVAFYLVAVWRLWIDMGREISTCDQSLSSPLSDDIRATVEDNKRVAQERRRFCHVLRYAMRSNTASDRRARQALGIEANP